MTETTIKAGCAATDLIDGDASGGDANGGDANGGDASGGDANGQDENDPNGGLTDSPLSFMSVFAPLVMAVMFAAL
jgi:hypothetical protein